jgi:hypothetical protein
MRSAIAGTAGDALSSPKPRDLEPGMRRAIAQDKWVPKYDSGTRGIRSLTPTLCQRERE